MNLYYDVFGVKEPIIFVHGLFGTSRLWGKSLKYLARFFPIVALDLRNHGKSGWSDNHSYEEMSKDLIAFIEKHEFKKVHLLGHSMGGKVVMETSLQRPDLVKSVIVSDMAPVAYEHAEYYNELCSNLLSVDLSAYKTRREIDLKVAELIKDDYLRGFLLTNIVKNENGYSWTVNLKSLKKWSKGIVGCSDYTKYQPYDGKSLFLRGEHSEYITDEYKPVIRKFFPNSRVETVKNAGHIIHIDNPDDFITFVKEFIEEVN